MSFQPERAAGRFRAEMLFRPASVVVVGSTTVAGREVLGNIRAGGFAGPVREAATASDLTCEFDDGASAGAAPSDQAPELGVVCTDDVGAALAALGARGTRAAVVMSMVDHLADLAEAAGVRAYGPGSFGIAVPAIGLHAIRSHVRPLSGRAALVSQSASLCRAVLDWAEPNGVGFSHVVGVGGAGQLGFAMVLDWLSRDAGTGVILLDIRRIRDPRRFLSAARAAARLRPVVAIRPGGRLLDPAGAADATLLAALNRVGVLCVDRLDDFLAAAETLTRARLPRGDTLAIVTNAVGPARLAADAALRDGLALAPLAPETRMVLGMTLPPDAIGEEIAYVGPDDPIRLAEAAALLAGAREVGGVLVVHAPGSPSDPAAMQAIVAASRAMRVPLLACAMGETTGAANRRALAEAGVAEFATPEQAVRGFLHLVRNRRNRAAARELPSSTVLQVEPDRAAVDRVVAGAREAGRARLDAGEAAAVLDAYGVGLQVAGRLRLRAWPDAVFGPVIGIGDAAGPGGMAVDLPPLNLALAHAMLGRLGAGAHIPETAADALVRVSQLLVDRADVLDLDIDPLVGVSLRLREHGDPAWHLALPPYPSELTTRFELPGAALIVRPIRPEDAAAHAALFARLSPEDIRYRFFAALRALSPEQIARMTQIDYDREMAFVAVRETLGGDGIETLGIARLVQDGETPEGEFAVIVDAQAKGHGLARYLMERLIAWARARGMTMITGQVLADNAPMLAFVRRLGMAVSAVPGDPTIVEARLRLGEGGAA